MWGLCSWPWSGSVWIRLLRGNSQDNESSFGQDRSIHFLKDGFLGLSLAPSREDKYTSWSVPAAILTWHHPELCTPVRTSLSSDEGWHARLCKGPPRKLAKRNSLLSSFKETFYLVPYIHVVTGDDVGAILRGGRVSP